ncbi:Cu(I)-responsive transcriptional regulator [Achromobacter sp. F4_2707]|uniref:Cu(I)-responsive transcriptional regulator n=1 Tax=Achromobacter sp. F4_2707 TaxID=3114286 RepID=UPI0039C755B0
MNIGQAAKATGVSAKMIRYYEDIGLIPPVARTSSGYRTYSNSDLHRLNFVRQARDLGFSVKEIGDLLSLWSDRSRHSADVKRIAQKHISELRQKIAELNEMVESLQTLVDCCAGDDRPECPILERLERPDGGEAAPHHCAGG